MKTIEQICADYHNVPVEMIYTKTRKHIYVVPRQQAVSFYRKFTRLITERIGMIFNIDHSSVIYYCKNVEMWVDRKNNFNFEEKQSTREIETLLILEGYRSNKRIINDKYDNMGLRELFHTVISTVNKGGDEVPVIITAFEDRMIKTGIEW